MIYKSYAAVLDAPQEVKQKFSADFADSVPEGVDLGLIFCTVTEEIVDKDGDVILVSGVNTSRWEKNPRFLVNHPTRNISSNDPRFDQLVKANTAGAGLRIAKIGKKIWAALHCDMTTDLGKNVFAKYKSGEWNTVSMGAEDIQTSEKTEYCAKFGPDCKRVICKCTLLEVSACPGGAEVNPDAQVMLAKSTEKQEIIVENIVKTEEIKVETQVIEPKIEEKVEIAKAKYEYKCIKCSKSFESDEVLDEKDMLCDEHDEPDEDDTVEKAVETPTVAPETVTTAKAIELPTYFYYSCGPSKQQRIAEGYIDLNTARK